MLLLDFWRTNYSDSMRFRCFLSLLGATRIYQGINSKCKFIAYRRGKLHFGVRQLVSIQSRRILRPENYKFQSTWHKLPI